MKKYFIAATCMVLAAMMFWLVGCSKDEKNITSPSTLGSSRIGNQPASPTGDKGAQNTAAPCNGTTLSEVFNPPEGVCFNYYNWSCTKTMDPGPFNLCRDICKDVTATVSVTKGARSSGFSGTLCVTNGGAVATTDLKVGVSLESKSPGPGQFAPTGCTQTGLESQHPVLASGETYCYTYSIDASPCGGISTSQLYRVNTDGYVTITNHSGPASNCGVPKGPNEKTISVPGCAPTNNCIDVTDIPGTPVNALSQSDATSWAITVTSANPVNVCASGDVNFTIHICNVNAPDEETWTSTNKATVGSGNGSSSCGSSFALGTVGCRQNPGCSLTQGFWKTHGCVGPNGGSQYGNNPNLVTPLLGTPITMGARVITTCNDAGAVFQGAQGNQGNAIKRLYSQMLAALLNIRSGADGSCVSAAIDAANAVLSAADPNGDASGWSGISGANRSAVQSAASTFDQYNNGLLCVPHCE